MKFQRIIPILMIALLGRCAALSGVSASSQSLDSVSTSLNSISTGLKSVSSVSGSLASISGSSMDKADVNSIYKMDVRDLTFFYATTKVSSEWEKDMFLTSRKNGVLSWQSDRNAWEGIGEGLKKAGMSVKELEHFLKEIQSNVFAYTNVKKGYSNYQL